MKLELKHLAPYLPYKVLVGDGRTPFELTEYNFTNVFPYIDRIYLRPLSDLNTRMEDGHEYIELLYAIYGDSVTDFNFKDNCLIEYTSKDKGVTFVRIEYTNRTMPYYISEFLFQHHFDLFGLIEQGLAIDINTLEK